jgi:SRSO17 transposase
MDVETQILKHLARDAERTVPFIDDYCSGYKDLFPEVRSYECFKYLHLGIIAPIKTKSLPEIAKIVKINSAQSLHHFIAHSPWCVKAVRKRRLKQILSRLKGKKIKLIIDETGDRKKGKKTDYVARQYLGSIGKVDNGIVTVNAYGVYENITFPLTFKVYKPKGRLLPEDTYQTKIELASLIIEELIEYGFAIDLVLADSLYGESSEFIKTLDKHKLPWILSIRSNHGVYLPADQKVRSNKWCEFRRQFSDGSSETRYVREIVFGKRSKRTYWEITTCPKTLPENSTSFVMTNLENKPSHIKKIIGNMYGLRTWIEYGFRQCKQELGWTDYRFIKFEQIEKWWEIILSAYWMITCQEKAFITSQTTSDDQSTVQPVVQKATNNVCQHQQWSDKKGWKNTLNNLRLIIQPTITLSLIAPWLEVFPNTHLLKGFRELIELIACSFTYFPTG